MLDGVWNVYSQKGDYLGKFQTNVGNDILYLDEKTAPKVSVGDILHMDETCSQKAWRISITGKFPNQAIEFEKLSDRVERYPDKPGITEIISHS